MLNIVIKTIKHKDQRYNTVGDWVWDPEHERLTIFVSDLKDWKKEFLVAMHELVEVFLCEAAGITQLEVDQFDMMYPHDNDEEPGDHPKAPYRIQHFIATNIERQLARELNVDWRVYDKMVDILFQARRAKENK